MTENTKGEGFYGWWLLPILCLVYSIPIGFALYSPPVIYQFMQTELHWQRGELNLGYTAIGLVIGLGAPLTGWLINRLGPRVTLTAGAIITAISSLLIGFLGQFYPAYIILSLLMGLGIGFGSMLPIQSLVLYWFNTRRAMAMGLVLGGGAIGGFIYPQLISAGIVNFGQDWRVGWNIIAFICFTGAIIAIFAIRNRPEDMGQFPDGISPERSQESARHNKQKQLKTYRSPIDWKVKDSLRTRSFWFMIIAMSFIFFIWQLVLSQTPFHLRDRGFVSSDPVLFYRPEFIYGLTLLFSLVGRLSISFLGELVETRILVTIAGCSILIGAILFWFVSKDALWIAYIYPAFIGCGFGATYVSLPLMIGNYFGVGSFASIGGITTPIICVFQYAAPAMAGFLYDVNGNYGLAILIACIGALIGTILILFCTPPKLHEVNVLN